MQDRAHSLGLTEGDWESCGIEGGEEVHMREGEVLTLAGYSRSPPPRLPRGRCLCWLIHSHWLACSLRDGEEQRQRKRDDRCGREDRKRKKEKDELTGHGNGLYILTYIILTLVFTVLLGLNFTNVQLHTHTWKLQSASSLSIGKYWDTGSNNVKNLISTILWSNPL